MRLAVLLAAVFAFAGCKSTCRQLSEKMCDCSNNTSERTACLQRVANVESLFPPTAEDEATCEGLVDLCDCRLIDTPEGKERCGFARLAPDGGL